MSGTGSAVFNPAALAEQSEAELIETRFGKVTVYRGQPIVFPSGLLGMPDKSQFSLTHFPSEKMGRFKLLQSLEDHQLSFITLPVDLQNPIVDRRDIEQAARELDIPADQLATLLIVSVQREAGGTKLSVNARAPIMLHTGRRLAVQYVFGNAKYEVRQPLTF